MFPTVGKQSFECSVGAVGSEAVATEKTFLQEGFY